MVKVFEFPAKIRVRYEGPGPFPTDDVIRRWLQSSLSPGSNPPKKLVRGSNRKLASNDVYHQIVVLNEIKRK